MISLTIFGCTRSQFTLRFVCFIFIRSGFYRHFPVRCPISGCDVVVSSARLEDAGFSGDEIARWDKYELKAALESQPDWRPCLVRISCFVIR